MRDFQFSHVHYTVLHLLGVYENIDTRDNCNNNFCETVPILKNTNGLHAKICDKKNHTGKPLKRFELHFLNSDFMRMTVFLKLGFKNCNTVSQ